MALPAASAALAPEGNPTAANVAEMSVSADANAILRVIKER